MDLIHFENKLEPNSTCSGHGEYKNVSGQSGCYCNKDHIGRICEYDFDEIWNKVDYCKFSFDCYSCSDYDCNVPHVAIAPIETCLASGTMDGRVVHTACRSLQSVCYTQFECERMCPPGMLMLGSTCFREELTERFTFFLIVMGSLTVVSIGFELITHKFEHYLEHHHQKGLIVIIRNFKSELMLIGLIGLSLFLLRSTESFEHLLHFLNGSEEIIEGVHFLIFFVVVAFLLLLLLILLLSKVVHSKLFDKYEAAYLHELKATALKEDEDEQYKKYNKLKFIQLAFFAIYFNSRAVFHKTLSMVMAVDFSELFPYNTYAKICLNDLFAHVASSTWMLWLISTLYFFTDLYLRAQYRLIPRAALFLLDVLLIVYSSIISKRFGRLSNDMTDDQNEAEERTYLLNDKKSIMHEKYYRIFPFNSPKFLVFIFQLILWLAIVSILMDIVAFTTWMNLFWSSLLNLCTIVTTFLIYGPGIAVSLHNGPNLNFAFIKEAVKHRRRELAHSSERSSEEEKKRKIERLKLQMDLVGLKNYLNVELEPALGSLEQGVLINQ